MRRSRRPSARTRAALKTYTTDVKPFLDPFDALIEAGSVSGDLAKSVVIITVHDRGTPPSRPSTREDHHHSWQFASGSRASARTSSRAIGSSSPTAATPVTGVRSRRSATTTPTEPTEFVVDADRAKAWLDKGAQPSDTVARLFRQAGILPAAK